ncbi:DUF6504 family protein, partial [Spirillospora sp. NPDC049652]
MTRVFGDPVEVRVTGGRPAGFAWRGRRYAVRRVLEHWVTTRDWGGRRAGLPHRRQGTRRSGTPSRPSG